MPPRGYSPPPTRYVPFPRYDALVARLGTYLDDGTYTQRRDALAMLIGLHGLRITEVVQLKAKDLVQMRGMPARIAVRTLKGGHPRNVELGPGVADAIRAWRGKSTHDPLLFTAKGKPVAVNQWEEFCGQVMHEIVGVHMSFHALRHTYAMRCYACEPKRDVHRVKRRLGHRSTSSTMVYIDAWADLEDTEVAQIEQQIADEKLMRVPALQKVLFSTENNTLPDDEIVTLKLFRTGDHPQTKVS